MPARPTRVFAAALAALALVPAAASAAGDRAVLPLAFVPNAGQAPGEVRFEAHGNGFAFAFRRDRVLMALGGERLALRFAGARSGARPRPERRLAGRVSYLRGRDRSRWQRGLPTYGRLAYRELWRGVDLRLRGAGGRLKYDLVLRPGARLGDVALVYEGARGLQLDADGDLLVRTRRGRLEDARPVAFQRIGGRRVAVRSRYVLRGGTRYGFRLGKHDSRRPVVIDPGIAYATYLGGAGVEDSGGIAVDASGAAYVTGMTASADFPDTPGALDGSGSGSDAYVAKLNPSGTALEWATYLGGDDFDESNAIAVDASGHAFVTGMTRSGDFPASPTAYRGEQYAGQDAFVARLEPDGSGLVYASYLGGAGADSGQAIALEEGRATVAGATSSGDFPTTNGGPGQSYRGGTDGFVATFDASGVFLPASTYLGGAGLDYASGVDVRAGQATVTGVTGSTDYPVTSGAFDTSPNGQTDAFVTRLSAQTTRLAWSTYLGGGRFDAGNAVAVDAAGAAYVAGRAQDDVTAFPTTAGALDPSHNGDADAFVSKLAADGASLAYSTFLGTAGFDSANAVALAGTAVQVAGVAGFSGFPVGPAAADRSWGGGQDAFATRLDAAGAALVDSTYLGGTGNETAAGVAVGPDGGAYVAGRTDAEGIPATPGALDTTYGGAGDAFVVRLGAPSGSDPGDPGDPGDTGGPGDPGDPGDTGGPGDPAPPGPGGGAGGGAPPPGAVPVAASFRPDAGRVSALQSVRLDASAALRPGSGVTELAWDLTGDRRPDVRCGPEAPVLQTEFARAGTRTVSLTVRGAGGVTATTSQRLDVTGAPARAADRIRLPAGVSDTARRRVRRAASLLSRRLARASSFAACLPGSQGTSEDVTALGGPAAGCVTELQVPGTLLSAVGCLEEVPLERIPSSERALINREILGMFAGLGVPSDPGTVGSSAPCSGCGPRARSAASMVDAALLLAMANQVAAGSARFWVVRPGRTVRLNGLDYAPAPGRSIVVVGPGFIGRSPRLAYPAVVGSAVAISAPTAELGPLQLRRAARLVLPINLDRRRIADLRLSGAVPFAQQTSLRGDLTAVLRDKASELVLQLALPPVFSKPGGGPVTGTVTLRTSNREGMRLAGFEVRNIDAEIAGVGVDVEYLRFVTEPRRALEGKLRVALGPAGEIEGEASIGDGIRIRVAYEPGPPGIKVAPGIFLFRVSGGFEDTSEATRFFGDAGLAAGAALGDGCAPVGVTGGFDFRIDPAPVTLTVAGDMQLACIPVAYQRFVLAADGYAEFSAGLRDYDLGPVTLNADWGARFFDGHFTAEGSGRASVDTGIGEFGISGSALISDRGLAMCAGVDVLLGEIEVGFGLDWNPPPLNIALLLNNLTIMAPSCDVGPWRTVELRARAAQAGPLSFDVGEGERAAVVGLVGADDAPPITLRDPSGRELAMPPDGILRQRGVLALRVPDERTTYVMLARPAAGRWTVEPQGGARIQRLQRAPVLPEPEVRAKLRPAGDARVVDVDVRPQPGQVVRLYEQAPGGTRELGLLTGRRFVATAGARGDVQTVAPRGRGADLALRLEPSDAAGVNRALVAVVEQGGVPRDRRVLATFRAGPPSIGRPQRVRVRRSRNGQLTISWRRARGAQEHLVGVELGDGRARMLRTRRTRVTLAGVAPRTRVTVRVVGARANGSRRGGVTATRARPR